MITWNMSGPGGTIDFGDGVTVWLQGNDANIVDEQVERCETQEQQQALLDLYRPDPED